MFNSKEELSFLITKPWQSNKIYTKSFGNHIYSDLCNYGSGIVNFICIFINIIFVFTYYRITVSTKMKNMSKSAKTDLEVCLNKVLRPRPNFFFEMSSRL